MTVVKAIFSNFIPFLMAMILTLTPNTQSNLFGTIDNVKKDCNATVELISDIHIEAKGLLRTSMLELGLTNLGRTKVSIDGVVVCGDLTNYADEPSIAKYFEIIKEKSPAPVISVAGNHDIGHAGDRDVTDISREEAKANFIKYYNEYSGSNITTTYYSTEINGYKFIVLGDDVIDGGHFDAVDISPEQLAFLDRELATGTAGGKPVFVCCHWPVDGTNGQETIWPGCGIDLEKNDIKTIMEKYENVFYISGHMHSGIKSREFEEQYGFSNAEVLNGVTYLSIPSYGLVNSFGLPQCGTGAQLEIYDDEVVFRPRNFVLNKWYENSEYHFEIAK